MKQRERKMASHQETSAETKQGTAATFVYEGHVYDFETKIRLGSSSGEQSASGQPDQTPSVLADTIEVSQPETGAAEAGA